MSTEPFEPSYDTCKEVSDLCPVSATLYGHFFSKPASTFFAVGFAVSLVGQLYFAYKSIAWSFALWVGIGTLMELIGYVCRVMMADNPWKFMPFVLQLFTLMLAPTFIAAGISVTFKHLVIHYGPQYSLIRPKWVPWLFVGSDIFSILIQAVGCALAAMATSGTEENSSKSDISAVFLILGVSFQAANMMLCGGMMLWFRWKRSKALEMKTSSPSRLGSSNECMIPTEAAPPFDPRLEKRIVIFVWTSSIAFVAIIIRCIYRIPEMAAGWGSSIMQHELSFLILDAAMVFIAAALLTVFHPAKFFPLLSAKSKRDAGIVMTTW